MKLGQKRLQMMEKGYKFLVMIEKWTKKVTKRNGKRVTNITNTIEQNQNLKVDVEALVNETRA